MKQNSILTELKQIFALNHLYDFQDKSERFFITEKLKANDFNVAKTAIELKIDRTYLHVLMTKYGIKPDRPTNRIFNKGKFTLVFASIDGRFELLSVEPSKYTLEVKSLLKRVKLIKSNLHYTVKKIFAMLEDSEIVVIHHKEITNNEIKNLGFVRLKDSE